MYAHVICCSVLQHGEEIYRMDRCKRGKLVLICNTVFHPKLKLKDRKGTDKDIDAIKRVFRDLLHFEVLELREKQSHEMLREVSRGL